MKKVNINDLIQDELDPEEEIVVFLMFSGELGKKFMTKPKRKRKTEEYARLLSIAIVFGFRRILMRLILEGENRLQEILDYLENEGKDLPMIESWIKQAVDNCPDEAIRTEAWNVWTNKLQAVGRENFCITKMFCVRQPNETDKPRG